MLLENRPVDLVSVIVINWNGRDLLAECLSSLRRQGYASFSTILVDNGSSDGSLDFVSRYYPEVELIALSENMGFSAANNVALRRVSSKYVALLNNDAVAHPLWLKSLVEALETHESAGFAASKIIYCENKGIIDRAGDSYTRAGAGLLRGRGARIRTYDDREWIFGACAAAALYRMNMLDDVGMFDEDFFLLYEDVDLSFRAQLKGYKCLYVPEAIVYHKVSASIVHDSPASVYYGHRNLEWVYFQNMPGSLLFRTGFMHIVYNAAAFFYFGATGRFREFLRAKWDALKGLRRALSKRNKIQGEKRVSDRYIWSLMEREFLFSRLTRRFRRVITTNGEANIQHPS
jgi:GT2 family glycosyltransferase